jgi:hypothetical protein
MKKRRDTTTASGVAGVNRTAAGTGTTTTGTTGATTPPAGPNVYSSKTPKVPNVKSTSKRVDWENEWGIK